MYLCSSGSNTRGESRVLEGHRVSSKKPFKGPRRGSCWEEGKRTSLARGHCFVSLLTMGYYPIRRMGQWKLSVAMKIVSRSEERSDERGRQFSLAQIISIIPPFGWDNSIIIFAFIRPDLDDFHYPTKELLCDFALFRHYSVLLNFV